MFSFTSSSYDKGDRNLRQNFPEDFNNLQGINYIFSNIRVIVKNNVTK